MSSATRTEAFMTRQVCTTAALPGLRAVVLALAILSFASPAFAQAVYGSIGGIVKDASGAILPGATVTITSIERKSVDTVVSNESGFYTKERLLPGIYEVKAEITGFKSAVVPE